jgi:isopropylmalate/homocitrate/citramalate synthase
VIEVGPMSGKSNVVYWLETRGLEATDDRVTRIYERAKQASEVMSEEELMRLI